MFKLNKKTILGLVVLIITVRTAIALPNITEDYAKKAQTGDLIFQTQINNTQSIAIQLATLSPYNHVGVVVKEKGLLYVYEANGPVKKTRLKKYTSRKGTGSRFVVYRHKEIKKKNHSKIISYLKKSVGKKYDIYLNWSDSRMYCSELAYKSLNHAGLTLNTPVEAKNMTFALHVGKAIPNSYLLEKIKPDMKIVAPSHLSRDKNFRKVFQNW